MTIGDPITVIRLVLGLILLSCWSQHVGGAKSSKRNFEEKFSFCFALFAHFSYILQKLSRLQREFFYFFFARNFVI